MTVKLSDIFVLQMGKTPSRVNTAYWATGHNPWVSISDLSTYEKYVIETKEQITDIAVTKSGIKVVPENTVIMSFKLSIGKTAITVSPVYTNEAIMAFIPTGKYDVHPDYFYHLFSGRDWDKGANRAVMGATLNKATLGMIEVNVPSLENQKTIASVLNKLDEVISKRREQLAKLDELVKARFVEMFGDPKDNSYNWTVYPLGSLFSVGSSKRIYQSEQVSDGIPFLRISDLMQKIDGGTYNAELFISENHYNDLKRQKLVPISGDILVTSRGTLGRCYEIQDDDKFYFQDGMISWLYDRKPIITNCYIMKLFQMPGFRKQIDKVPTGTTVNYLSLERLKNLQIMCPDVSLQDQFTGFVEQINRQKLTVQQSLDTLELLKKALMQKYFG